jgi:hypothetical protein
MKSWITYPGFGLSPCLGVDRMAQLTVTEMSPSGVGAEGYSPKEN